MRHPVLLALSKAKEADHADDVTDLRCSCSNRAQILAARFQTIRPLSLRASHAGGEGYRILMKACPEFSDEAFDSESEVVAMGSGASQYPLRLLFLASLRARITASRALLLDRIARFSARAPLRLQP